MRMFAQNRVFHRGVRVDLTGDPEALRRFGLLRQVDRARLEHGLTLAAALDVSGCRAAPTTTGAGVSSGAGCGGWRPAAAVR